MKLQKKYIWLWTIIIVGLATWMGSKGFPWYFGACFAFLPGALFFKSSRASFLVPFIICALMWVFLAAYQDYGADVSIAGLLSSLFSDIGLLPVYLATGLIFGLVGGFAALTGNYFSKMVVDWVRKGIIKV